MVSMVTVCMVLASGIAPVRAQDAAPPDLQMLLNLDLFRPQPQHDGSGSQGVNSSESTLDQIRTLNALGYLGNSYHPQGTAGSGVSGALRPYVPPEAQENPE
jgi:hypothetical protein